MGIFLDYIWYTRCKKSWQHWQNLAWAPFLKGIERVRRLTDRSTVLCNMIVSLLWKRQVAVGDNGG